MERIDALFAQVQEAKVRRQLLVEQLEEMKAKREEAQARSEDAEKALELVATVAKQTQLHIGERISGLVSLALAAVFERPYTFVIDFVQRRGTTEADLFFQRDGNQIDPMSASGGGPIDIASFALRLAVWSLGKSRPLFFLDEPFRNLSLDLQAKAGLMVQELSKKLGIQIIMVSHNPEIISGADKVIRLPLEG